MANGHGGRRPGAGRPVGIPSKLTLRLTKLIGEQQDLSPGRIGLEAMWFHYRRAARAQAKLARAVNDDEIEKLEEKIACHLDDAWAVGKDVAPYVHTRLTSIVHSGEEYGGPIIDNAAAAGGDPAQRELGSDDLKPKSAADFARLYRASLEETEFPDEEPPAPSSRN